MSHSRAEVALLQKAFAQAGPIRNLRHVQGAVLTIPRFLPGEMLLAAAAELQLLPTDLQVPDDDAVTTLSPEQLDRLLETAVFPNSRILTFPQFLSMMSVIKRRYTQSVAGRSSPSSIRQAVQYVVATMGDWKEEENATDASDGDAGKTKKKKANTTSTVSRRQSVASASSPLSASQVPSEAPTTSSSSAMLEQYLSWFGVRADPRDVTSEAFLNDVQAADVEDGDDAAVDLLVPPHEPIRMASMANVGHIAVALVRHRRTAAQRKNNANLTARGSALDAIQVPVLHAMDPTRVAAASDAVKLAAKQQWLNPEFPEKGSGPRASFFTHDTPPTTTDVNAHQLRVVAASMRSGARKKAALCSSSALRDHTDYRSLADLLRLPQLSETSIVHIHDVTDAAIAESAQRRRNAHSCSAHRKHMASFWCTGGPQRSDDGSTTYAKRALSSTELNYRIDETYRRAQQLGVSTSKATATVERRLAEQRRAERSQRIEAANARLRSGFVL